MHKIATINARIEPDLKTQAESILNNIGLSSAEAIRLFYKQVCLNKGLPFAVKIPNAKTAKAMQAADNGETYKASSTQALFNNILKNATD